MTARRTALALAILGATALGAIVIITVTVVRHRSTRQGQIKATDLVPGALLHAHNFHWTQMKGGQSQWILKARDASYAADRSSLTLMDAEVAMTTKDGRQLRLAAPLAKLRLERNHIDEAELSGGLVVHYGDFVLTTPEATFAPDKDELQAKGVVTIQGKGVQVSGVGLAGHPKAEVFELLKQVSTRIMPGQKGAPPKAS